jgi:hypothetical protein
MSQRSPNFEQPMPQITTLSLMPLAMIACRLSGRCLPEIAAKAARPILILDAVHEAHGVVDLEFPGSMSVNSINRLPPSANSTLP